MKINKKIMLVSIVSGMFLFCVGCRQDGQEMAQQSIEDSAQQSLSDGKLEEESAPIEKETASKETEDVTDEGTKAAEDELTKYDTLTWENLEEVLTVFMSITSEEELWKLEYLPFTERLCEKCRSAFPYTRIEEPLDKIRMDASEYGVNDDTVGCNFVAVTVDGVEYYYYVKMGLLDGKVDKVDLLLIMEARKG